MVAIGRHSVAPAATFCLHWFIDLHIAFKLGVVSQVGKRAGEGDEKIR